MKNPECYVLMPADPIRGLDQHLIRARVRGSNGDTVTVAILPGSTYKPGHRLSVHKRNIIPLTEPSPAIHRNKKCLVTEALERWEAAKRLAVTCGGTHAYRD